MHKRLLDPATLAGRWGDAIALDDGKGGAFSYADLPPRVAAFASEAGVFVDRAGPVAVALDHGPKEAVAELWALDRDRPILSLPPFFSPEQRLHALGHAGAIALLDATGWSELGGTSAALPSGTQRITFTSGSTGTPKGICLSADHLETVAARIYEALGARHAGRHLAVLPPGTLLETVAGLFATLLAGGTWVCPPQASIGMGNPFRPDFALLLARIEALAITSLILVPEYLAGLVAAMEATGTRLPRLTIVAVGGARTAPDLVRRARHVGLPVRLGYGLTETGSVASLQEEGDDSRESVGIALPHVALRLAEDGEIVVDRPAYLGTIGHPRTPAPLHTGDIGSFDAEGRLSITGRKSSLIVTSFGRNISPEWIESLLLDQPGIAQALVYGDGLPHPRALLVAAAPGADLAAAVDAVNACLPDYAQVSDWRPAAPFTPFNGQLTGNGRMIRNAILHAYRDGETPFFTTLEAATWPDRLRFLGVPQVRAGLSGEIALETYLAYLGQAYHHVRHTVPLMREARARLARRPALVAALDDYIAEETGHEEWILSDIAAAGGDAERVRSSEPGAATRAMTDHAYHTIRNGNPAAFFGMVYVLESVSVALASRGASAVQERLGLPPEAFTYLTSHGALDAEHMGFFEGLVNRLEHEEDGVAIQRMAIEMFALFGGMFASIPLGSDAEAARVPA